MLLWWRDFLFFLFPMAEKLYIYIYKDSGGGGERRGEI